MKLKDYNVYYEIVDNEWGYHPDIVDSLIKEHYYLQRFEEHILSNHNGKKKKSKIEIIQDNIKEIENEIKDRNKNITKIKMQIKKEKEDIQEIKRLKKSFDDIKMLEKIDYHIYTTMYDAGNYKDFGNYYKRKRIFLLELD